jgi:phosphopantothenoylcysteine decarboxylase/phosphopantothenate--cysteine ligase
MAAAVADYTPIKKSKSKIKKSKRDLAIRLRPTVDILKWAGKHKKKNQIVVGFALEDENLRASAEKKLKDKNLDMIIADSPAAVGSDSATVQIKTPDHKWLKLPYATKTTIAKKIVDLLTSNL